MNENNLRVIKTARSEAAINDAVTKGFWPIVKPVTPSPEIKRKCAVFQDALTGKIEVVNDFRCDPNGNQKVAIDFTFYYPHNFESPFAAYLVPSDIKVNEVVWLEDLIEDVVGNSWNQGDTFRLQSSEATWDGKEFILSKRANYRTEIVG